MKPSKPVPFRPNEFEGENDAEDEWDDEDDEEEEDWPQPVVPVTEIREQWYPLNRDPELHAAGVEIGARVLFYSSQKPTRLIVFRAGGTEARVDCERVAIYPGSLASFPPASDLARSSKPPPVTLAPEEHYIALNSYVAGIAATGLAAKFALARDAGDQPVDFPDFFQGQIIGALLTVCPAAAASFCWLFLDDLTKAFSGQHMSVRLAMARHRSTPPQALALLAGDPWCSVRQEVAWNFHTPPEVLAKLAEDPDDAVGCAACNNRHMPR